MSFLRRLLALDEPVPAPIDDGSDDAEPDLPGVGDVIDVPGFEDAIVSQAVDLDDGSRLVVTSRGDVFVTSADHTSTALVPASSAAVTSADGSDDGDADGVVVGWMGGKPVRVKDNQIVVGSTVLVPGMTSCWDAFGIGLEGDDEDTGYYEEEVLR